MAKAITLKEDEREGGEYLYPLTQVQLVYDDRDGKKQGLNKTLSDIEKGKVDRECQTPNGKSTVSNLVGDEGACMTFENIDGIKSGIGVDKDAGTRAQLYAINVATKRGSRLNITENAIYYMGKNDDPSAIPTERDEIATIADVTVSASKCWGIKETHADMMAITGMNAADYVYVLHDETRKGDDKFGPSTRYYRNKDNNEWIYACDIGNTSIRDLGKEKGSGQPYHFPYFYDIQPKPEGIYIGMDTITLDNKATTRRYDFTVPPMDGTNAGLYTKAMNDTLVKAIDDEKTRAMAAEKANADAIAAETKRATDEEAKKLNLPGNAPIAPHEVLRLPYFFEQEVQQNKVVVKSHNIKLDNTSPKVDEVFTLDVVAADIANDKAGLYTKGLADVKTDRMTTISNGKSYISNLKNDEGSVMKFEHTDGTWSGFGVNNGGKDNGLAAQIYAVNGANKTGTRINITQNAIYYTKNKSDPTFSAGNEIATIDDVKVYGADFVGNVAEHENLKDLKTKKIDEKVVPIDKNDFAVVLNDTPVHNGECWRYRYNGGTLGTLAAWTAEYRISNVPFTDAQWAAINSEATKTKIDSIANKVDGTVGSSNGLALMFNEADGGGAKFEHKDGTNSYIGVNDGGKTGVAAQIYAVNKDNAEEGVKLNVRKEGIYYLKNKATPSQEDMEDEIATMGGLALKQDKIDTKIITVPTGGWADEGTTGFKTKEIVVEDMVEGTYPIVQAMIDGSTLTLAQAQQEAADCLVKAETLNGKIKLYVGDIPAVEFKIAVKVM